MDRPKKDDVWDVTAEQEADLQRYQDDRTHMRNAVAEGENLGNADIDPTAPDFGDADETRRTNAAENVIQWSKSAARGASIGLEMTLFMCPALA